MVKGVKSEEVIKIIQMISLEKRKQVKYISVDMANSMEKIANICFPDACVVTDRFHVAKLISEAVQDIRIKHRWKAIDKENQMIENAKKEAIKYIPSKYENGDTEKQLLARSRYLLFKTNKKWTDSQKIRAEILFRQYPEIHKAYKLSMMFRNIYETAKDKRHAKILLNNWYDKIKSSKLKSFNSAANSVKNHEQTILNYFPNKVTNALAENFNSKIKAFRATFRGVRDLSFFLFRVANIFA